MGKLKKHSRNSRLRRLQQSLGKPKTEEDVKTSNKVAPLIQKLSSASPNDRSMAISALSLLCEDEKTRKHLLKEKLVNIVMEQCLNDNSDEVIVQSFGLLRNLVLEEGYDLSKFLIRSKIIVTIEANINKLSKSLEYMSDPSKKVSAESKRELFDFIENLVGLTTGLLISDQTIFDETLPKLEFLIQFIVNLLKLTVTNLKLSSNLLNTLFDFIYQAANQSTDFILEVSKSLPLDEILSLKLTNNLSRVYIEALRFHFNEVREDSGITNKHEFVLNSLSNILSIITQVDVVKCLETIQKPVENTEKIDVKKENKELFDAKNDLESIDVALDLIATLIEFDASEEEVNNDLIQFYYSTVAPALIQLLTFKDQSFLNKSLICLNNLSWLFFDLKLKPVEWFETSCKIWDLLFGDFVALQQGEGSNDVESMADYLKVLGVTLRSLGQTLQGKINVDQLEKILTRSNTIHETVDGEIELLKDYFYSLISFLTSVAMIQSQPEVTLAVGEYLLKTISASIAVLSTPTEEDEVKFLRYHYIYEILAMECTSALFEIFGDKSYDYDDAVFVKQDYLSKLMEISLHFRPVHKEIDKNRDPSLKEKLKEVSSTLIRFIEYKKSE